VKYFIKTYGCQMNELDSELVAGQLTSLGYRMSSEAETADVVLYNTCSVRDLAEQKVRSRLGEIAIRKQTEPELVVGVQSIRKGHAALLVGNVIGADILNVLFVIGASATAKPLPIVDTTEGARFPEVFLALHLPAMLLAVSRLVFAWAEDGIFPRWIAAIHPRLHTPHRAVMLSGIMASIGILGSHFAGDFFLGIDIMVTSMLVNFLLMCIAVLTLPTRNPALAAEVRVITSRPWQKAIAVAGIAMLSGFFLIHVAKDLSAETAAWYFHSTPVWLIVMSIATVIYFRELGRLKQKGVDLDAIFGRLPPG